MESLLSGHWVFFLIPIAVSILLFQSTWLFLDAQKKGHSEWFWGILGLIQFPLPLFIYLLFVRNKSPYVSSIDPSKLKKIVLIGSVFILIIVVAFGITGSRPAQITLEKDESILKISGMYGEEIPVSTILRAELIQAAPELVWKSNGISTYSMAKGYFTEKTHGKIKVFITKETSPYIYIYTEEKILVFNFENPDETKAFYEKLGNTLR